MQVNIERDRLLKPFFLALAIIISVYSADIYFHGGIDNVYTHLFYIPIIMAGIWYHRQALYVAGALGALHISVDAIIYDQLTINSLLMTCSFLIIALVVGLLSEKRDNLYRELNDMLDMVIEINDDGMIQFISTSSLNLIGYSPKEIIKTSIFDLIHKEDLPFVKQQFDKVIHSDISMRFNYRCRHKNGSFIWVETLVNPVKDDPHRLNVYIFGSRNISARKKAEEELHYLSLHDPMTGLYNRMYFEEELKRFNSGRFDPIGIIVADIDGLKATNDNFGHDVGDRLIKNVSRLLLSQFRSSDIIARIGGDEFVVFMPNCSESAWEEIINRVIQSQNPPVLTEDGIPMSISIGYALRTDALKPLPELLREADAMMYKQKAEKRKIYENLISDAQTV